MARSLVAAALAGIFLVPGNVAAGSSPSPALRTVLAEPVASGFTEVMPGQGAVSGAISLAEIASVGTDPNQDAATLKQDGFIAAWGRTWIDNAKKRELQEIVLAFSGGAGAVKWLGSSKKSDSDNQYFVHDVSVRGVGSYYGAHLANPMLSAYLDIIGMVKGNDYFLIAQASTNDDLDAATASQAKGQYDFAPSSTIPPAQWPEHPVGPVEWLGALAQQYWPYAGGVAALLVLVAGAFVLIRRRRRGTASMDDVQMSPDGSYWWDGQAWRDAISEAPPSALRSADGFYWWDGRVWRLMPDSNEPPATAAAAPAD